MGLAGGIEAAVDAFAVALGTGKVLTSEDRLREFRDPFAPDGWDEYTASAVVMPTSVEEIQQVPAIANETGVSLWTHSQGRNNGYGGPAPRVKGSVIVSLRDMNRVLEINERLGYAVVEPGVRWSGPVRGTSRHAAPSLMVSLCQHRRGAASSATRWSAARPICPTASTSRATAAWRSCSPTATVMRTGMGAMEGQPGVAPATRHGMGPTPDQMFMQSNFGIVTRMGVWLMPKPEVYMPLTCSRVWNDDDLGPLIDTVRELMLDGTIRMMPQIVEHAPAGLARWRARPLAPRARARSRTTSSRRWAGSWASAAG